MNTKIIGALLAATFLLGAPAVSLAANPGQCKDAKGKFIKCPPAPATTATTSSAASGGTQCRDAKGKFTKCPTTPAKPKQCRDAKGKFTKC